MAFRAIYDIVFHAESFRNIDLFYQGLYYIKISISTEANGTKIFAHPYSNSSAMWPASTSDLNKQNESGQMFKESLIDDEESSFSTKTFLIKFCEEEVEINDFCHFRIEIDTCPSFDLTEFQLEATLVFHDCNNTNSNSNGKGNSVSSSIIKMKSCFSGKSEFIPLIFYEQNFSVLNSTIHVIGTDFHHRLHTLHLSQFVKKLKEPKYNNDSSLLMEEILNKGQPCDFMTYLKEKYKGQKISTSFFRSEFTKRLENNFELLYSHYEILVHKCIDEKQRKQFQKFLSTPQKLIIPEYMKVTEDDFKDSEDPELIYAYIFSVS